MTAPSPVPPPTFDRLAFARTVLRSEAASLVLAAGRLDARFERVVDLLHRCRGRVAVTGIGKSADIGQKLVGTFNSTGTRSYLLDPTRAVHGDLGMVHPDDAALLLSHSGESEELLRLLRPLRKLAAGVVAITGNKDGTLAKTADAAIVYGPITEACPLSLAPSTSTTVMLAVGDALAFTLSQLRQFTPEQFAAYHPAGSLGKRLATVEQYMRRGAELRTAPADETVRQVFARVRHTGRRTGAVMLTNPDGTLAGLFTDSDLARLFESHTDAAFDKPIRQVMTRTPVTVPRTARLGDALDRLRERKISELPVVDEDGKPVGLLDITDLIGVDPDADPTPSLRVVS
jgi:arabinose-5-phosphate isomerase